MRDRRGHIFLSYRRADSAAVVDHIYDRLVARYGKDCIFRDLDSIPLGTDFRDHVRRVIGSCDVVLAIIGRQWHGGRGSSAKRIMEDDDPVRIEIEVAIESGALLIPVLVGGAGIPKKQHLPPSLQELPALNGAALGIGRDFEHHLILLFRKLDEALRLRGKSIVRRPDWLQPAATAAATIAVIPLLLFLASTVFEIPFGPAVVPVGVVIVAVATAMSLSLFFVDWSLSGRGGWSFFRQRPLCAGTCLFLLGLPLVYGVASQLAHAIPVRDVRHLSRQLLVEYGKARAQIASSEKGDFTAARRIVDDIRDIDPEHGIAWYFAGEILRLENSGLFDSQSCFRGRPPGTFDSLAPFQQDFRRYIELERALGGMTRITDWGTEPCYASSARGYCPQRTAWVYQLLAHDNFVDAGTVDGDARIARLTNARDYVQQALRYNRPEGGVGFTQCMDSSVLLSQITSALESGAEPQVSGSALLTERP